MKDATNLFEPLSEANVAPLAGRLIRISYDGIATVDFPGNPYGPIEARSVVSLPPSEAIEGRQLLLVFEGNHFKKPIIIGIIEDRLVVNEDQTVVLSNGKPDAIVVDGKKLRLDAREEIELVCGKSSILLRKNGKIVIKGKEILSRSSCTNEIKGVLL